MAYSAECSSVEKLNLDNQQFRPNKINEVKDYFIADIKERELMSKKLRKYIAFCDYFDKSLIFLSATCDSISVAAFAVVIGTPVGKASSTLTLAFSRNKKKNHNNIIMLARSKLNNIESKISEALINNQISHEDFLTIVNEKRNYRELKESIRMMTGQDDKKIGID